MALTKEVMLKILASDGDAQAKLDAIAAKADELRADNPELIARIDTAEASAKLAVFRDQLKATAATTDEVAAALDEYNTAAAEVADTASKLAAVQRDDSASADAYSTALDENSAATLRALDAQMRLMAAEEKAGAAAQEAGDSELEAGTKAKTAAGESEESAGLMAGAWEKTKFALLGVAAGLVYGTVKAAGFQSIMTTLSTQAGVSKGQLASLGTGVLNLAGQVGDDPDSLAQALYHIESSFQSVGITGPKALNLLKTAAEGAAVGHANLVDVTNALDATIASGVGGVKNYSQAMGALNAIVGSGDMTMEDLANAMGTGVMAVAKSFGQNIDQVGAALALFGDNNIRGAKAATELRMAWQAMQAPLTTAGPALKSIGLTMTQLGHTMEHQGMSVAIQEFVNHLKASKVPMSDWGQYETEIFGKKAGVGIGIMVDQLARLKSKFPDLEKGAKGFGSAWAQQQKTVGQQWKDLESGVEALAIKMGEKLLPAAMKVVSGLTRFVNDLEKGKGPAVALAAVIGGVLATTALGKLVTGVKGVAGTIKTLWEGGEAGAKFLASGTTTLFSGIKSAVGSAASGISSLIGKLTGAAGATDELAVATEGEAEAQGEADVAMDANPIGAIIIAMALLAGGIYEVIKHWKDFRQWGLDAWHAVSGAAVVAGHFIEHVFDDIKHDVADAMDAVRETIVRAGHDIEAAWDKIVKVTEDLWHREVSFWKSIWHDVTGFAEDIWHDVTGFFSDLWHDVVGIAETLWHNEVTNWEHIYHDTLTWVERLFHDAVSWFEKLPGRIMNVLSSLPSKLFNLGAHIISMLASGITSAVGDVTHAIGNVASEIVDHLPFSPAKKGPLSGSGDPELRGRHIAELLGRGMISGLPSVDTAANRMAASLSGAVAAGQYRAGAAGGGGMELTLEFHMPAGGAMLPPQFWTEFMNGVRAKGGDPRIVLKKVKFA